jgi:purine-binding chemotaxis protein CheW
MQTTQSTTNNTAKNDSQQQVLTFTLGSEIYGLDILRVQEIKGWEATTPIPNVPSYVKGVINLRGVVVPIVDLRERFDIAEPTYDATTVVIIVKTLLNQKNERILGMVVDSVSDVYTVDLNNLQAAPKLGTGSMAEQEFVMGLATLDGQMMILLDVDHLVQDGLFHALEGGRKLS